MPGLASWLRELRFWPRGEQAGHAALEPQEVPAVRTPTRLVAASLTTATQPMVMTALMETVGSAALAKISCATVAPDQPLDTDDVRWFDRGNAQSLFADSIANGHHRCIGVLILAKTEP